MPEVLTIHGLTAGYGPLRVLHEIDFHVEEGERVGLVGLNGHGKTTLFRAVSHLVGWQNGSIRLNGEEIGGARSLGPGRRTSGIVRKGLAMTPQGDAIFPGLTVRQHLDCGAYSRLAWRERRKRRDRVMDIFPPLRKLEDALVGKLSGGERRMVSVGRALMVEASLYLIDEPSLGLAPKISASVIEALFSLPTEGRAMVIAEQNVALLTGRVDRMIGMHAGRLRGDVGHVGLE
ncbi:ATP-binding cassette domain-containing protein [Nitratireductor sp. XY-223]|uniref:ABC transporter ATP-binding protein n=1 Tax=Nitratireductor sp. XY-223 TaxID=2561926 RepID=UPI0010AA6325|nr:ATP-binding cassette domain-containing protein [Nitratireductor sp. XY-223]